MIQHTDIELERERIINQIGYLEYDTARQIEKLKTQLAGAREILNARLEELARIADDIGHSQWRTEADAEKPKRTLDTADGDSLEIVDEG